MYRIVGLLLVVGGLIIAAPATVEAAVYQGTVIRVDADKNVIETADDNELEHKFVVTEGCKITLDAKEADLKDLVAGTVVTITTKKVKGKAVAVKIEGRSPE
ncbi:MAG TPA: hypothetical protein VND64_37345 [Pirellulales bacterium]|nr:hypothetical protein [Pirellulales bacterium]